MRAAAVALWCEHPAQYPDLADAFLKDADIQVRRALVLRLPRVRTAAPEVAESLEHVLAQDGSAIVRWTLSALPELGEPQVDE